MTYKIQIDDIVREATADEALLLDQQRADAQKQDAAIDALNQAAVSARAKLAALGLTKTEIEALVG